MYPIPAIAIHKSVPADRQEEAIRASMQLARLIYQSDEEEVRCICLHEGTHWIYGRQIGMKLTMQGPSICYDAPTDTLSMVDASVDFTDASPLLETEPIAAAKAIIAPTLVVKQLTSRAAKDLIADCAGDMQICERWFRHRWPNLNDGSLTEDEAFLKLLSDVRNSVLIDLQNKEFCDLLAQTAEAFRAKVFV